MITEITDLALGTAAEHLVCADLLLRGYNAFLTDQNCAYDIAVDIDGRLVRVQIKSTRRVKKIPQIKHHRSSYMFFVRRAGKGGKRVYKPNDFDLLALVATDCKQIAYLPPSQLRGTVHIRTGAEGKPSKYAGNRTGKYFFDYPLEAALKEIGAVNESL
jgi:hypothetical protein